VTVGGFLAVGSSLDGEGMDLRVAESRREMAGETDGTPGAVELKQFCFEQGEGSGVPHPD